MIVSSRRNKLGIIVIVNNFSAYLLCNYKEFCDLKKNKTLCKCS